jgi:methylenetetrahydrofolate--tRNA-(uracil-5-)-methyltransferase
MLNLVGFQNHLKFPEQKRIFRMIPGLENAEFLRLGQIPVRTGAGTNPPSLWERASQFQHHTQLYLILN